jgi:hypothetical protein
MKSIKPANADTGRKRRPSRRKSTVEKPTNTPSAVTDASSTAVGGQFSTFTIVQEVPGPGPTSPRVTYSQAPSVPPPAQPDPLSATPITDNVTASTTPTPQLQHPYIPPQPSTVPALTFIPVTVPISDAGQTKRSPQARSPLQAPSGMLVPSPIVPGALPSPSLREPSPRTGFPASVPTPATPVTQSSVETSTALTSTVSPALATEPAPKRRRGKYGIPLPECKVCHRTNVPLLHGGCKHVGAFIDLVVTVFS